MDEPAITALTTQPGSTGSFSSYLKSERGFIRRNVITRKSSDAGEASNRRGTIFGNFCRLTITHSNMIINMYFLADGYMRSVKSLVLFPGYMQ